MRFETEERGKRRIYHIRKPVTSVGRDLACDISIASVSVSRRHAEFSRDGGRLGFKDLASRNGLRLNGKPAAEGVLSDGDRLSVGEVVLVFHAGESPEPAAPEPAAPRAATGDENVPTPLDLAFSSAGAPPPAAPEPAAPVRPPPAVPAPAGGVRSRRVLWAAAASALLVALAAAVKALLPAAPPVAPPAYTPADYAADIHHALQAFQQYETLRLNGSASCKEELQKVRRLLQAAHKRLPQAQSADLLDRALSFNERLEKDYRAFRHDEAHQAWEELKKVRGLDPEVLVFASDRQKWMEQENGALLRLEEGRELADAGKSDEALAKFATVPLRTLSRPAAEEAMAGLRREAFGACLARSEAASGRRAFDEALAALDRAAAHAQTPEDLAGIETRRRGILADRQEEADFQAALKAYESDRPDEAKALLAKLSPSGPFQGRAEEIRRSILQRESLSRIRGLFADGKGPEALAAMAALPVGTVDPAVLGRLKDLITRVLAGMEEAGLQERQDRLREAALAWRGVRELLSGGEYASNPYRAKAEAFLSQWTDVRIADHYVVVGTERFNKEDFAAAREAFELARQNDPAGERGAAEVKKLVVPRVQKLRLEAFTAKTQGNREGAVRLLEQAFAMLRPGDGERGSLYEGVLKELKELKGD